MIIIKPPCKVIKGCELYILCLFLLLVACRHLNKQELSRNITQYTIDSLSIHSYVGNGFTIIDKKIKGGLLLLGMVSRDSRQPYLAVIDIKAKKLKGIVKNPASSFYSSVADVVEDTVYAISSLHPDSLFRICISGEQPRFLQLKWESPVTPANMLVSGKQMFLFTDVYGVSYVDLPQRITHAFHSDASMGLAGPGRSGLALPFNKDINLLGGYTTGHDVMSLLAIDSSGHIRWTFNTNINQNDDDLHLLSCSSGFVVAGNDSLVVLNKVSGDIIFRERTTMPIYKILKIGDSVLVASCNGRSVYSGNEYPMEINLYNLLSGKYEWEKKIIVKGIVRFYLANGKSIISDDDKLFIQELSNGNVIKERLFHGAKEDGYAFDLLMDQQGGDYYLYDFYNDVLYF